MANTLALHLPRFVLRELIPHASYVGKGNIHFRDIATHSDRCTRDTLFVALSGSAREDGLYLRRAVKNGAVGVLTDFPLTDISVPQCIVPDVRAAYGRLCQQLAGNPAERIATWGVTGTNGKTTTTWMLRSILRAAGDGCGLLGTIEYDDGVQSPESASMTTPDAACIAEWMGRMAAQGTQKLAMEVSSHALDQQRLAGISLAGGIITNITHDHLDYHGSFEAYSLVKARLAKHLLPDAPLVVNGDDPTIRAFLPQLPSQTVTVGFDPQNAFRISIIEESLEGTRFQVSPADEGTEFLCPLPGRHNVYNAAFAVVLARQCGIPEEPIRRGLGKFLPPPGRLERVDAGQPFACFVDYAHTPDAISQVLSSLRPLTEGRLICLFGAGGERDREKRPAMARSAELADLIVLTADNSREEATEAILADIRSGFSAAAPEVRSISDRKAAIDAAVSAAEAGDCLLILGKGHEKTQQIGNQRCDFDDVVEAQATIRRYYRQTPYVPAKRTA